MADSQRKTANLSPIREFTNNIVDTRAFLRIVVRLYNGSAIIGDEAYNVTETGTFSYKSVVTAATPITRVYIKHDGASRDIPILDVNVDYPKGQFQFTVDYQSINPQTVGGIKLKNIMLNYGSTPLPYEPYGWVHSLRKLTTATEAVENPLYSDGTAITAYTIKGNTVQNGTPTPSNPVEVNGVGERTAQLWDISSWNGATAQRGTLERVTNGYKLTATSADAYTMTYGSGAYSYSVISGSEYTISWTVDNPQIYGVVYIFTGTSVADTPLTTAVASSGSKTFTVPSGHNYVAFRLGVSNIGDEITYTNITLNEGSTPLHYEPYGYKIPISSGQQTIDIYIGDLPLLKSLDGTAVDEISNGTLTRRVDSDGTVLPTPTTTQITMPSIPTTDGANTITVDTTVQPSEFTATWTGWHDANVQEWDGSQWG